MRVFLSYAREDIAIAQMLARFLESSGLEVWWDRHIAGGEEFSDLIEAELAKADAVVVIWSPHSIKSRWVRDEAAIGGDSGRLVPLAIDGAQPPMGFRQFQTLDLAGWKGGNKDPRSSTLLHSLERHSAHQAVSRRAKSAPSPRPWSVMPTKAVAIAAIVILVLATVAYLLVAREGERTEQDRLAFAILPFRATPGDDQLQAIADQSRDFMADAFTSSGIAVRLTDKAPAAKTAQFVITGNFNRIGQKLQATVRIDELSTGSMVMSKRFEVPQEQADVLADRVGAQIAGSIGWAASLIMLEQRHPSKPSVTPELVRQLGFDLDLTQAYQTSRRLLAINPHSPFANISYAFNFSFVMSTLPDAERKPALLSAREAAARALQIAPEFGDAHSLWCRLHSETLWAECERKMLEGQKADPDAPFVNAFLSQLYEDLGRFEDSSALARLTYSRDPFTPTKMAWMLRTMERAQQSRDADEVYSKGLRWWPNVAGLMQRNRISGLLERGDLVGVSKLGEAQHGDEYPSGLDRAPHVARAVAAKSSAAVRTACTIDDWWPNQLCMVAFAQVGDLDSAFEIADKLFPDRMGQSPAEAEAIWLKDDEPGPLALLSAPSTAAMRRDPRFLEIARRSGVLQYWRTTHLPDFCTKAHEAVCAQIRKS